MRTLLLFLTLPILFISESIACSISAEQQHFCDIAQYSNYGIIRGKVVKKIKNGIKIKVFEVYRGEATEKEITVWDAGDWDCNGIPFYGDAENMGKVGETIVALILKIEETQNPWDEIGDYRNVYQRIGGFEKLQVKIVQKGDKIKGPFAEGVSSFHVDKLAEKLRDCIGEQIHEQPIVINGDANLKVYPNPTSDYLFIDYHAESADVSIYDIKGQLVAQDDIFIAEEGIKVDHLPAGVYICMAKIDGVIFRQKFIVFEN